MPAIEAWNRNVHTLSSKYGTTFTQQLWFAMLTAGRPSLFVKLMCRPLSFGNGEQDLQILVLGECFRD